MSCFRSAISDAKSDYCGNYSNPNTFFPSHSGALNGGTNGKIVPCSGHEDFTDLSTEGGRKKPTPAFAAERDLVLHVYFSAGFEDATLEGKRISDERRRRILNTSKKSER